MILYLCVTNDEYELPVAVADTQAELARMRGVHFSTISGALRRTFTRHNINKKFKYIEVEVTDD